MDARKEILSHRYIVFAMSLFAAAIVDADGTHQFVQGDYWRSKADNLTLQTHRGVARKYFSDNGSMLATSVPIYDLRMDLPKPMP